MSISTSRISRDDAPGAGLIPEWTLADRLRKARQTIGLGQREFAAKLEVTAGAYQQWEASMSRPRNVVATAKRIEMLTGVSATWILGLETAEPRPITPAGAVARPEGFEPPTFCSVVGIHSPSVVTSLDDVRRRKTLVDADTKRDLIA